MPPASGLRRWGTPPGSSAGFLGPSGWGQCPPLLLVVLWSWTAPLACLSCSPSASLLGPQDQHGPEGASEGVGPSRLPQLIGQGKHWASYPLIQAPKGPSRHGNSSPLSTTPQVHQSCLASISPPASVPPHPTSSLGGSSHLLGHRGPPPPASGRLPSCGGMQTLCLPTPPS